ncbi:MAG: response regulator [Acidimicrobiia bacterium]
MALILVVDDEPDIRELIQLNLEAAGHRVVTASNGKEALAAVEAEIPDAMFLDVMMPGVDGWSVLEEIKAGAAADISSIPIMMVTGVADPHHQVRGGIEGALRYITKPFDPAKLVNTLEEVLGPDARPEPEQRRQVQRASLEALARLEKGGDESALAAPDEPRVRLTSLEHAPITPTSSPTLKRARDKVGELTDKQRELLEALASGEPVTEVSERLGVSRSNVYASLQRIARKLGLASPAEVLALVRQGLLLR